MKTEESWTSEHIVIMYLYCISLCVLGVIMIFVFQSWFHAIPFFFCLLIFGIPTAIETRNKLIDYAKKVKASKRRKETVIVGGLHKKKRKRKRKARRDTYPVNDETSKATVMREFGLSYEKPILAIREEKHEKQVEKKKAPDIPNTLLKLLDDNKRIRINKNTHFSKLRGRDIARDLKRAAHRSGEKLKIMKRGDDIIISK